MQKRFFYRRFIQYFLTFLVPVLLVLSIMTVVWVRQEMDGLRKDNERMLLAAGTTVEHSLSNVAMQNSQFTKNPYTLLSLKRILSRNREFSYSDALNMRSINAAIRSVSETYSYIRAVYLYLDDYENYYTSSGSVASLATAGPWAEICKNMTGRQETAVAVVENSTRSGTEKDLYVIRRLDFSDGAVVMEIDLEDFSYVLDQVLKDIDGTVAFFDENGAFLFSWGKDCPEEAVLQPVIFSSDEVFEESCWLSVGGDKFLSKADSSTAYNLILVSMIPIKRLIREILSLLLPMGMVLLAGIFSVLVSAYLTTSRNFAYMNHLVDILSDAEKGVYPIRPYDAPVKDENDVILNNVIFLFLKNVKLMTELKEKEHDRETAQLTALQAQINPHFLFNTLQTIAVSGQSSSPEETSRITLDLSEILTYALADPRVPITLQEEMVYLKKYVSIQHSRFGDSFIIYYDIEEGLETFPVFRLMLQPLIENSILHGVRYKQEGGYIRLSVFRRDKNILFRVLDTGIGMEGEELEKLRETIETMNVHSVGLSNVNCRLKLYFGEDAGLKILSKKGYGTSVSFLIPENWTKIEDNS